MIWKKMLCTWSLLIVCISVCVATDVTSNTEMKVEESTVSPIADMAIIPDVKASTERPPTEKEMKDDKSMQGDTQRHTVADFIIHPLIAFKPRTPDDVVPAASGRQSDATTTTPSPWQIFGINPGQGLGSLAGSVTGWLNDRIPSLVQTSSTSTTTTTQRPDIVVRVQQRTTRRPLVSLANNNRPFNNNNNFGFDSDEFEDEEYDYNPPRRYHNRRRYQNNNHLDEEDEDFDSQEYYDNRRGYNQYEEYEDDGDNGDNGDNSHDAEDEEDDQQEAEEDDNQSAEENFSQRPNNRRRPIRTNNNRRGPTKQTVRTRPQNDDESSNNFFYNSRPSTKRSQSPTNFIQRGQQSLINQIRQLTRVQSPAEVSTFVRQPLTTAAVVPLQTNRPQGTLFVNRNGQTVYVAPELAAAAVTPQYQLVTNNAPLNLRAGQFPQPPLTKPLRAKGQPTQYITIPWNQLGISPPNRLSTLGTELQSEPHILNIPQSAINAMQNPNRKSGRPIITAEAVPLLAEASLMDIFQPPQIPPSRSTIAAVTNSATKVGSTLPNSAVVTGKTTKTGVSATPIVVVPQRIRGGTLIEKAPAVEKDTSLDGKDAETASSVGEVRNGEQEYILVGEDGETGLTRQVQPVYGDARYMRVSNIQPYFDVAPRTRYGMRKSGRALEQPESVEPSTDDVKNKPSTTEQHIPVEIVGDKQSESQSTHSEMEIRAAEQKVVEDVAAVEVPIDGDSSQMPAVKT